MKTIGQEAWWLISQSGLSDQVIKISEIMDSFLITEKFLILYILGLEVVICTSVSNLVSCFEVAKRMFMVGLGHPMERFCECGNFLGTKGHILILRPSPSQPQRVSWRM